MKTNTLLLTTALALGASAWSINAQGFGGQATRAEQRPRGETAPPAGLAGAARGAVVSPLLAALDRNGDGTLDADEIAQAATSLKQLDKNGDGKLTPGEYRPPRPVARQAVGAGGAGSR